MKKKTKVTIGVVTGVVYVFVHILNALVTPKSGGNQSGGGGAGRGDSGN